MDYLYVMGRTYTAPLGFDIRHTYSIVISSPFGKKPGLYPEGEAGAAGWCSSADGVGSHRTYPGVESACLTDRGDALLYGKP